MDEQEFLLSHMPLLEDEQIFGGATGVFLDGTGNDGPGGCILVSFEGLRLRVDEEAYWIPLPDLTLLGLEQNVLRLSVANGTQLDFAADPEVAEEFANLVLAARRHRLSGEAADLMAEALEQMLEGHAAQAANSFVAAAKADGFNGIPYLFAYLLNSYLGAGGLAAEHLTEATIESPSGVLPSLMGLWPLARFTKVHWHRLTEQCGLDGPIDALSVPHLMLSSLLKYRLGEEQQALTRLRQALSSLVDEPAAGLEVLQFAGSFLSVDHLMALGPDVLTVFDVGSGASETEEQRRQWTLLAEFYRSFLQAPRNQRALADGMIAMAAEFGAETVAQEGHRVLEQWAATAEAPPPLRPDVKPEAAVQDLEALGLFFDWAALTYSNRRAAERAWAWLRLDRLTEARRIVGKDAEAWHRRYTQVYHPRVPDLWLSALVAAEIMIADRQHERAIHLLREAYATCVVAFADGGDLYQMHGGELFGLYTAIAGRDAAQCRLYSQLLAPQDGFRWTESLLSRLYPEALTPVQPAESDANRLSKSFAIWLIQAMKQHGLERDLELVDALRRLHSAQNNRTLRVSIVGETSAGKSTFINALLGVPLLYTTQEEATALPTVITRGRTWQAQAIGTSGQPLDTIDLGTEPQAADWERFRDFIKRYSFLGALERQDLQILGIRAPSPWLWEGVEYIDTPGFNAHAQRTDIARRTVEDAHACLFLIDARNALKRGEMSQIAWISEVVGKTIFVVNKMDAVISDDDLDCDTDSAGDLLARIRSDLAREVDAEDLALFAVSSLAPAQLKPRGEEAMRYAHAIQDVRKQLQSILTGAHSRLVAEISRRTALQAARTAEEIAMGRVRAQEIALGRLAAQLPDDPTAFRKHVFLKLGRTWAIARQAYIDQMGSALDVASENASQALVAGLQSCSNREELKAFVQYHVRSHFNNYLAEVEQHRAVAWDQMGRAVLEEVTAYFRALYENISFEGQFDASRFMRVAKPLPLVQNTQALQQRVEALVSKANKSEVGGAAIGAVIGTFLAPGVGTAVGAFLGGMVGSSKGDKAHQRIYEAIWAQFGEVHELLVAALVTDVEPGEGEPQLYTALSDLIDTERRRFETLLRARIQRARQERAHAEQIAQESRRFAVEASDWGGQFTALIRESTAERSPV